MNKNSLLLAVLFVAALFLAFCPMSFGDENTPTYAYATAPAASTAPAPVPRNNGVPIAGFSKNGIFTPVSATDPFPVNLPSTGLTINQSTGILGTFTLSLPLATATALPAAPAGAKDCFIFVSQDTNWGDTGVTSATDTMQFFFANIPGQGFFGYNAFTGFRLRPQTAVATASGIWR